MKRLLWAVCTVFVLNYGLEVEASSELIQKDHQTYSIVAVPPGGILINAPGKYVFENDILWSPVADGAAIVLSGNGIELDLQGHALISETTSFSTTGILAISAGGLTIKNGTISNMGLGGINCTLCPNLLIKHITVDGLNMNNTATFTVPFGILAFVSTNVEIHKCLVQNLNVQTASMAGIQCTGVTSSYISDCTVRNLLNRDGACTGIGHLLCDFAEVKNCTIDNLKTEFINNLNTEGHTSIGIIPVSSQDLVVKDCTVTNVVGCCDDAHGISIFECLRATVKKCHVENVLDGAGPAQTGAKATGIEIYATEVTVEKCSAKNIQAINPQDKQAAGFSCAQGSNIRFIKCFAENVTVVDENGNKNPALGYGTGFGWAPDPRPSFLVPVTNVFYYKCTAENCQVGFDSWYHINSRWKRVKSICNDIPFLIEPNGSRTLSCDACSECGCLQVGCYPTPLTVTISNVASGNLFYQESIHGCKN